MSTAVANALVPVFFVLGLGYYAGWRRIVDNQQVRSLNALVMNFALPIALFVATAQTPRAEILKKMGLVEVLALSMWSVYGVNYWLQRRAYGAPSGDNAVRTLTVALPNYAAVGLPLLESVLGPKSAVDVALAIATGALLLAPITLVILAGEEGRGRAATVGRRLGDAVLHVIRRPVVLGPFCGVAVSAAGLQLPELGVRALNLIGEATPGAALFLTGLVLSAQPVRFGAPVLVGVVLKGIVQPALALGLALMLGLPGPAVRAAVLLTAIPTGFFGIVFGLAHNVKSETAGSSLMLSSIGSALTLTFAINLTSGLG